MRLGQRDGRRAADRVGRVDHIRAGDRRQVSIQDPIEPAVAVDSRKVGERERGVPFQDVVLAAEQSHEEVEVRIDRFRVLLAQGTESLARAEAHAPDVGPDPVYGRPHQLGT